MAVTKKRLAHVVLQTTDLNRLRDWYLQVLDAGMPCTRSSASTTAWRSCRFRV